MALFDGSPRSATVTAESPVLVMKLTRRRFVPHGTGMLAMRLAAAVGRCAGLGRALAARSLAAAEDVLELMFNLREAPPQLGIFCPQFGVLRLQFQKPCPVVHGLCNVPNPPETGK